MTDSLEREFVRSLRESDRSVAFHWSAVSAQVRRKRANMKTGQRIVIAAVTLLVGGLVLHRIAPSTELPNPGHEQVLSNLGESVLSIQEELLNFGPESQFVSTDALSIEQFERKLNSVQAELIALQTIQSEQQWAIAKETISRTEMNYQALAAYHSSSR